MSGAAVSDRSDRIRFPFVTPAEKDQMEAAIKREQAAEPFDNRAPLAIEAVGDTGLLGVPRKGAAAPTPSRRSRRPITSPVQVMLDAASAPAIAEREPTVAAEPVASIAAATSAMNETEEMRGIKRWLVEEMDRIEQVVVAHLGRAEETKGDAPMPSSTEISVTAATERPESEVSSTSPTEVWHSGPIDLDEARDRKLAGASPDAAHANDFVTALGEVPDQFAPKRRRPPVNDGSRRASGLRLSRPAPNEIGEDDIPQFLRAGQAGDLREAEQSSRPSVRGAPVVAWTEPMRLVSPAASRVEPRMSFSPKKKLSAASGILLAYAVFAMIPAAEWLSGSLDPCVGSIVPAVAFLGWLLIHMLRRDQIFQLRVLTAWQIAHTAGCMYVIRPWAGYSASVYWIAAAMAVGGAILVVAASAAVEAYEYRAARMAERHQQPRRMPPPRAQLRVPAE
jgi:hypothetical protein